MRSVQLPPSMVLSFLFAFLLVSCQKNKEEDTIYSSAVKCYAQMMIEQGRDVYGDEHSPLFASSLDRATMKPDTAIASVKIPGVRKTDRSLAGANMIHDIGLYQILYDLTNATGDLQYAVEADKALEYFFNNCQISETGLMCWG